MKRQLPANTAGTFYADPGRQFAVWPVLSACPSNRWGPLFCFAKVVPRWGYFKVPGLLTPPLATKAGNFNWLMSLPKLYLISSSWGLKQYFFSRGWAGLLIGPPHLHTFLFFSRESVLYCVWGPPSKPTFFFLPNVATNPLMHLISELQSLT